MDSQPSSQTSSYHVANVSPDPTVNAPTVNAPPVNAPPVNAPPVNANVSDDEEELDIPLPRIRSRERRQRDNHVSLRKAWFDEPC